jgi:hypothetical protein
MRFWVIVLACVVVFAAIAVPWAVISFNVRTADTTQLVVACQGIKNQVIILEALRSAFEGGLGVPWTFPIPEVPPECVGL